MTRRRTRQLLQGLNEPTASDRKYASPAVIGRALLRSAGKVGARGVIRTNASARGGTCRVGQPGAILRLSHSYLLEPLPSVHVVPTQRIRFQTTTTPD